MNRKIPASFRTPSRAVRFSKRLVKFWAQRGRPLQSPPIDLQAARKSQIKVCAAFTSGALTREVIIPALRMPPIAAPGN